MNKSKKLLFTSLCGLAAVGITACGSTGPQGETGERGLQGLQGDAGSDGQNGQSCYLVENIDGSVAIVCPYDGSSFIIRGNPDHYDNYCKAGYWGKNCENECNCNDHQICNDGIDGDGSCSCAEEWTGQDCNTCPDGFYDGNMGCVDCSADSEFFNTPKCTLIDSRDNNHVYKVVKIGQQLWMAENMAYDKGDGSCHVNTAEDPQYKEKYGCLYIWDTAQDICPEGWRLPKEEDTSDGIKEFSELLAYFDYDINNTDKSLCVDTRSKLQAPDIGNNISGFSALQAGKYLGNGTFGLFNINTYFWSASKKNDTNEYYTLSLQGTAKDSCNISIPAWPDYSGNSVRCIKD